MIKGNKNLCEDCIFENCWPETNRGIVTGYDDKGNGIICKCPQYEQRRKKLIDGGHYYDRHNEEIHEGDTILYGGKKKKVYMTEAGELGIDSTNPLWIEKGKAFPCEFGIYPFDESDMYKVEKSA